MSDEPTEDAHFGAYIRDVREERGLSIEEVVNRVNRIRERGEPTLSTKQLTDTEAGKHDLDPSYFPALDLVLALQTGSAQRAYEEEKSYEAPPLGHGRDLWDSDKDFEKFLESIS